MSFLAGLLIFFILGISSILLLIAFALSRRSIFITLLWLQWIIAFAVGILVLTASVILNYFIAPISLHKQDIIGHYKIDTSFYPGRNARWQHAHYRFEIKPRDSLFFYILNDNGQITYTCRNAIHYIIDDFAFQVDRHKQFDIFTRGPSLYRTHSRFYYVIYSDRYGNMFFRKMD